MARNRYRRRSVTSSRLKAFGFFTDQFSSSFRSGWKTIRSGWGVVDNIASSSNPSNYPLLSAPIKKSDVSITLKNPGVGTGAALWVTDSGNWWMVVTQQQESIGTGDCNQCNPINNCGAGGNCVTVDNRFSYFYDYGNNCINSFTFQNANNCTTGYDCQQGLRCEGGNYCVAGFACFPGYVCVPGYTYYYDPCKTGGNCKGTGGNCKTSNWCGIPYQTNVKCCNAYNYYNPCGDYNACVGGNVGYYSYCANTFYDNCANTGFSNCANVAYDSCLTLVSDPCATSNINYCKTGSPGNTENANCSCCGRNAQDVRQISGGSINYCGYTNACVATGGECTGHYNTYPRYIKIYKYVSSILTEVASQTIDSVTSFSAIKALKVIVSNSTKGGSSATITAKVYSDISMNTQIGSDFIHQATGLQITTNYGIIANTSNYNQNISVEQITTE